MINYFPAIVLFLSFFAGVANCYATAPQILETKASKTNCIAYSEDGTKLAYGGYKKVFLIDATSKKDVSVLVGGTSDITEVVFLGDKLIASAGKSLCIWDIDSGKLLHHIERENYLYRFAVSAKKKTVYVGASKSLEGIDIETGKSIVAFDTGGKEIQTIGISPDGKTLLASPKWGQSLFVYDADNGNKVGKIASVSRAENILFLPTGDSFFVNMFGGKIVLLKLSGDIIFSFQPELSLSQLALSNDGKVLIIPTWTAHNDERIFLFDIKNRKIEKEFPLPDQPPFEARMSPDGKTVVAATKDNKLHFFDTEK